MRFGPELPLILRLAICGVALFGAAMAFSAGSMLLALPALALVGYLFWRLFLAL